MAAVDNIAEPPTKIQAALLYLPNIGSILTSVDRTFGTHHSTLSSH